MSRAKVGQLTIVMWLFCSLASGAGAQEPARNAWIVNERNTSNARLARVLPEVHSVASAGEYVEVRSAGISLHYLGPFQTAAAQPSGLHQFQFRIPRRPARETGAHSSTRPDVLGVFVNGMPIYNRFEVASYQGQNLWHFDTIAGGDDGTRTVNGHPRPEQHGLALGELERLITDSSRHSPIIGFAFDGFPIYGPWAYASGDGSLRRMRSSYRLREIKERTTWPDGTALTPGQYGPAVNEQYPLGTFVEDYEYAAGTGDLDEFNGRFVRTPEYPNGTYAYFLTTDVGGRLAFPYLLARQYYGRVSEEELSAAFYDGDNRQAMAVAVSEIASAAVKKNAVTSPPDQARLTLKMEAQPTAARPARLIFQALNGRGSPIRHLEYVHERPMHLIIVSEDLAEFDHIHPVLAAGDRYEITHAFRHGGRYRLYADFTPPGAAQRVETFDVTINGTPRQSAKLIADNAWTKQAEGVRVALASAQPLRAGEDVELNFALRDAATGKAVSGLEPYLGAWAHFVIIDERRQHFIHAHPIEQTGPPIEALSQSHLHSPQTLGPPPENIRVITSFPQSGLYKLWAQFQRDGEVFVQPFILRVEAAPATTHAAVKIPAEAINITIGAAGFQPAVIKIEANKPTTLAITRDAQPNCGSRIAFPSLGVTRDLPLGDTTLIELPPLSGGELRFACGMGMYKGMVVVK